MPRTKLYQCPYDEHTKCSLSDPCLGCEEFAANSKEARPTVRAKRPVQQRKGKIAPCNNVDCEYYIDDIGNSVFNCMLLHKSGFKYCDLYKAQHSPVA